MGAWLGAAAEALASRRGCPLDDVMLDAEVAVSAVDAIGDAASVDPHDWPRARQRRVLEHLLSALDAG